MLRNTGKVCCEVQRILQKSVKHRVLCHHLHRSIATTSLLNAAVLDLAGIYPPIPTPFKENEDINWDALKANLSKWDHIDFKGKISNLF